MIIATIKCEMCPNNFSIPDINARPYEYETPEGWITLTQGNPQTHVSQHFCSKQCVASWSLRGTASSYSTQPLDVAEQPQSTIRRFWLIDGETADQIEGVKWTNGCVNIDPKKANNGDAWFYHDWNELKIHYPGSGVQWIDPEVSDAANSN